MSQCLNPSESLIAPRDTFSCSRERERERLATTSGDARKALAAADAPVWSLHLMTRDPVTGPEAQVRPRERKERGCLARISLAKEETTRVMERREDGRQGAKGINQRLQAYLAIKSRRRGKREGSRSPLVSRRRKEGGWRECDGGSRVAFPRKAKVTHAHTPSGHTL